MPCVHQASAHTHSGAYNNTRMTYMPTIWEETHHKYSLHAYAAEYLHPPSTIASAAEQAPASSVDYDPTDGGGASGDAGTGGLSAASAELGSTKEHAVATGPPHGPGARPPLPAVLEVAGTCQGRERCRMSARPGGRGHPKAAPPTSSSSLRTTSSSSKPDAAPASSALSPQTRCCPGRVAAA